MVKRILLSAFLVLFITDLACLKEAPAKVNKEAKAHLEKGQKYYEKKQFDKAISEFSQAISIDSNYTEAYEYLGDTYKEEADKIWSVGFTSEVDECHRRAFQAYDKAIALGTDNGTIYFKRGKVDGHLGNTDQCMKDLDISIEKFSQAVINEPQNAENYLNRGITYRHKWWFSEENAALRDSALSSLRKALELKPNYVEAYREMGWIYRQNHDRDSSIYAYSKVIELDSKDPDAYFDRGDQFQIKKEFDKALSDFNEALKINPNFIKAYQKRAEVLLSRGDTNSALRDYNKLVELNPNRYLAERGYFYRRIKNYDPAIADLTKGIELKPMTSRLYYERASCYVETGQYDKAIEDFTVAIEHFGKPGSEPAPETPEPYRGRADVYTRKGDYDSAIRDYTLSIENKMWNPAANYRLRGWNYFLKGDYENAVKDFTKWIELEPDNPRAYNSLGDLHKNMGKFDLALQDLNKGLEINPNHYYCTVTRGEVYTAMGDLNKALDDLDRAIRIDPKNPCAWYYRGLAYKKRVDRSNAVADFKKCVELGGYQDAQAQLEELQKKP
jgi:tetratricopeptide (TPR) repeat protein